MEDYTHFKALRIAKKILEILGLLYLIVLLRTPSSLAALPDLQQCLAFYEALIEYILHP